MRAWGSNAFLLLFVFARTVYGFGGGCECKATGDPHYHTCDGVTLQYQGACAYNLASTCSHGSKDDRFIGFRILIKNKHPINQEDVSYARAVKVDFGKRTIYMDTAGNFKVDGQVIHDGDLPYESKRIIVNKHSEGGMERLVFMTDLGFKVTLDITRNERGDVIADIPPWYKNAGLCGLCGNWNDNPHDDYATKDGTIVENLSQPIRDALIADSLHQHDPELDLQECEETLANSPYTANTCTDDQLQQAQKMCDLDNRKPLKKSFKSCRPVLEEDGINYGGYIGACEYAYCSGIGHGKSTANLGACTVLKSLSDQCTEHGSKAKKKWKKKLKCFHLF
ncbi:IgGFc-binding protein [Lingula anatina]|uniref:IgGFc-binding protein n=1 Tax=Lingula anatina TaxID=7574 RepID=A0A1S3KAS5_LINAN|nr:IgGFc-binding protein [Lingula anatina]XP_013419544.1 IgGFc-binding protein-like [Lingula anatina]XP_013419545.1 IgGFc-binding protein-like [Lingula anatina]XP_023932803.1 IgGFc-binding protein [Lingula anatina]|eukprot:XP_013398894.1 IgGFc-binding protein [Lingula anatina]